MMFEIIMNMPVRPKKDEQSVTNLVHRIICSYPVESMADIVEDLNQTDFIIVNEWYPNEQNKYENHGIIALNRRYIGKIKEWSTK
jgi:hypothetical protein